MFLQRHLIITRTDVALSVLCGLAEAALVFTLFYRKFGR